MSASDVLDSMYAGDSDLARRLGVDQGATELEKHGAGDWCLTVTVRRMLAVRRAVFTFEPGGTLTSAERC